MRCCLLCVTFVHQGPREDSGFSSAVDPGVRLASQLYTYCKKYHPKTQIMASGLRTKDGEHGCCSVVAVISSHDVDYIRQLTKNLTSPNLMCA